MIGLKIKVKKKKTLTVCSVEEEVLYSQVSRYWPNKAHVLSYLRGRCSPDNPVAKYLKQILSLRQE